MKYYQPYRCLHCKRSYFHSLDILRRHTARHHRGLWDRKSGQPGVMHYGYFHSSRVARHNFIPSREKPHQCKYCQKCFSEDGAVKIHEQTHIKEVLYQCEYCLVCFTLKENLESHRQIHTKDESHKEIQSVYKCQYCKKSFSGLPAFRGHIYTNKKVLCQWECCQTCIHTNINSIYKAPFHINHGAVHDHKTIKDLVMTGVTEQKTYQCEYCNRSFSEEHLLNGHTYCVHKVLIQTKPQDLTAREKPLIHTKEKANTGIARCEHCLKYFSNRKTLASHKKTHHAEGKRYKCGRCYESFTQTSDLEKHLHTCTHAQESTHASDLKCDFCQKYFSKKQHLKFHMNSHHRANGKQYNCEHCLKGFTEESELISHKMETHNSFTLHQCKCCEKYFGKKDILMDHMVTHHADVEKPYQCEYCAKCFVEEVKLTTHKKLHEAYSLLQCEFCKKSFTTKRKFEAHMKTHAKVDLYQCEFCKKSFTMKLMFKAHMKIFHAKVELYQCEFCEKSFTKKRMFEFHMKTHHAKVESYQCEFCEKSFTKKRNFKRHVKTHTNVELYQCGYCQKSFKMKQCLVRHTRIHTRYHCEHCQKVFRWKKDHINHIQIHTKEKAYQCECQKYFTRKSALANHKQNFCLHKPSYQ